MTTVKISTSFTPFQLVYVLEATLSIECEIPYLKLVVELLPNTTIDEERFPYLNKLDESRRDAALDNEAHKRRMKAQYDRTVQLHSFNEEELVLNYNQNHDKLGAVKFESMWHGPYVVSHVLENGAYELVNHDEIPLGEPRNGIYLKIYYA